MYYENTGGNIMQDFISYMPEVLQAIAQFLMTEPIKYFVGLVIVAFITKIVMNVCKIK